MTVCLGCGALCEECYRRLNRCLAVFGHWPLETSLTPAALREIETAVRFHLSNDSAYTCTTPVEQELVNLCTLIRAGLQHDNFYVAEPTDEELLA